VRGGADTRLPTDRETGKSTHTMVNVYSDLLLHICRAYRVLPDPRTMTTSEIRFYFEGIRSSLKPKPKQPSPKRPRGR
jgi:hypothetical protein